MTSDLFCLVYTISVLIICDLILLSIGIQRLDSQGPRLNAGLLLGHHVLTPRLEHTERVLLCQFRLFQLSACLMPLFLL